MSSVEAPRLSGASTRALAAAPIRIVLGVAAIAVALVRGVDPLPAFGAVVAGGIVLALVGAGQRSRAGLKSDREPLEVPAGAVFDPTWYAALLACVPSTIGVALMAGVALIFSPTLAALLGGVLVAMGLLGLAHGVQLAALERVEAVRYWVERGPSPRLFVSSRPAPRRGR